MKMEMNGLDVLSTGVTVEPGLLGGMHSANGIMLAKMTAVSVSSYQASMGRKETPSRCTSFGMPVLEAESEVEGDISSKSNLLQIILSYV